MAAAASDSCQKESEKSTHMPSLKEFLQAANNIVQVLPNKDFAGYESEVSHNAIVSRDKESNTHVNAVGCRDLAKSDAVVSVSSRPNQGIGDLVDLCSTKDDLPWRSTGLSVSEGAINSPLDADTSQGVCASNAAVFESVQHTSKSCSEVVCAPDESAPWKSHSNLTSYDTDSRGEDSSSARQVTSRRPRHAIRVCDFGSFDGLDLSEEEEQSPRTGAHDPINHGVQITRISGSSSPYSSLMPTPVFGEEESEEESVSSTPTRGHPSTERRRSSVTVLLQQAILGATLRHVSRENFDSSV